MNQQLEAAFVRHDDLRVFSKKLNQEQDVGLFLYEDESRMLTFRLLVNRTSAGFFLSELKNIDFFLFIHWVIIPHEISEMIRGINAIASVRMCVPVDLQKIKETEKLRLW